MSARQGIADEAVPGTGAAVGFDEAADGAAVFGAADGAAEGAAEGAAVGAGAQVTVGPGKEKAATP